MCKHKWSEEEQVEWNVAWKKGGVGFVSVQKAPTSFCLECTAIKVGTEVFVKTELPWTNGNTEGGEASAEPGTLNSYQAEDSSSP